MLSIALLLTAAHAGLLASPCVEGIAVTDLWPGEYPSPVVQVVREVTVPSRRDVCDPVPSRPCTLSPGLIHPWTTVDTQRFRSIDTVSSFELRQPLTVYKDDATEHTLPVGTKVIERNYLSEGMCRLVVDGVSYEGECPSHLGEGERFHKLSGGPAGFKALQFIGVQCAQGYRGWVSVDKALFKRDEIVQGQITGYGEIAPSTP